jgi:hypothetical protein
LRKSPIKAGIPRLFFKRLLATHLGSAARRQPATILPLQPRCSPIRLPALGIAMRRRELLMSLVNDLFAALFIGSFIALASLTYYYGIEWDE